MCHVLTAGGDKRNIYLANEFYKDGFTVSVCGFDESVCFDKNIKRISDINTQNNNFDIIVLPLPVTSDNITINAPFCHECICISDVLSCANDSSVITGGKVSNEIINKYGINIIDYAKRDDFAYMNAVPTAEGAIECAMKETPKTIAGLKCMVTGFGRCSEILSVKLKALDAKVNVFARSSKDLSHAQALGFKSYHLSKLSTLSSCYDLIFNSIPYGIFDNECIKNISPNCVFIDIASAPGGIKEDADITKLSYNFLPGLPGKYSPYTAGTVIKNVIQNIMRESGKDAYEWLLKD